MQDAHSKLLDANGLLENLFEKKNRPSLGWLRSQTKAGKIKSVKIGRLIFYNPEQVKSAWFSQTAGASQ